MAKAFYPTYLYVKTHTVTGLKYFGKTTAKDPYAYRGSGLYWMRHCTKHGWTFKTRIVGYYTDRDACEKAALRFSKRHDIVNAVDDRGKKTWANSIVENGLDGGATSFGPRPAWVRKKISAGRKGIRLSAEAVEKMRQSLTGRNLSDEHKEKIRLANNRPSVRKAKQLALLGRTLSDEHKENIRIALIGKTHSETSKEKMRGRLISEETRKRMSIAQSGKTISLKQRQRISRALIGRQASEVTKAKLSGQVVVVDKKGRAFRISKEDYYAQKKSEFEKSKYVAHRSLEGQRRLAL